MCGERFISSSWNDESSTTAKSSGCIFSASHSSGWPMLPPRYTVFPAARSISAMMLVVVVLPSLPVTPMIVHGQTSKKISISDVTTLPRAFASSSAGTSGRMPGVRKTTSARRSSR